ncbi:MAG: TPM domain-containing protein [Clostridia bacterium]|nr:TPM domain-containing protein [Clostridia bacterium]
MVKKLKRSFALLLIALLLLTPCVAFAKDMRVFDYAGLFLPDEVAQLEMQIADASSATGYDFVVLTSDDVGGKSSIAYADDFYDEGGFGTGEDYSGLLYFIDMDNRVPTISTCGEMIDIITDARLETLLDIAYDHLVEGEYAESAKAVIEKAVSYAKSGAPEGQYRVDEETGEALTRPKKKLTIGEIFIALAAGTGLFFLLRVCLKASYSIDGNRIHYDPYQNGTCDIKRREDRYLRSHVIHRRRDPPPSSGGSSHSSGRTSTVHRSSSGRSHGGGSGRKF